MTPYEIGVLIHYYSRACDHDDMHKNPPIWRPTIEQFLSDGLMENPADDCWRRTYRLTERGKFYVEDGLCTVPLPVNQWRIPDRKPTSFV